MPFRITLVIVTAFVGTVVATVFSWAGDSSPVQEGTSVELRKHACRVDLTSDSVVLGGFNIYLPETGCCVYYDQGMHGQSMYQVYSAAAADELPTVIIPGGGRLPPAAEELFLVRDWGKSNATTF